MDIDSSTVPRIRTGSLVVGTSIVALASANPFNVRRGVQLKADAANTGVIYVGLGNVTAGTNVANDGYPLEAGKEVFIPFDDLTSIGLIASASGQKIWFMVM